jgi:hypothetical protein
MLMITLQYSPQDPYGRYGVDHFIRRSGIPFEISTPTPTSVLITYAAGTPEDFLITISGNEIQNTLCGRIRSGNRTVPVCETPRETGEGDEVIAFFESPIKRYPCITRYKNNIEIGVDIFRETGYLLSGHLDRIRDTLDEPAKQDLASVPVIDVLEDILFSAIREGCYSQKIPLIFKSCWPDAKKFAVCLTHDVDEVKKTYQWITRPIRCVLAGDFRGLKAQGRSLLQKFKGVEPYWTFDDITAIEERYHASSTFFFLKETGNVSLFSPRTWNLYGRNHTYHDPRVVSAIRTVSDHGSEVAVHGSFYSFTKPASIAEETRELEDVLHGKVMGIRQHHLNLAIPDTWDYQADAGLIYDSSLGYKDRLGFRWGTSLPFYPFKGNEMCRIQEIPLLIMDVCLFSVRDPQAACFFISDEVEKFHGVLTLLWHPPVFNTTEFPDAREIYCKTIERAQERGALVTNALTIATWENNRTRTVLKCRWDDSEIIMEPSVPGQDCFISFDICPGSGFRIISGNAVVIGREVNSSDSRFERIDIRAYPDEKNKEIVVMNT